MNELGEGVKMYKLSGNNWGLLEGRWVGRWGNWVMGIKEGMWCNKHWILHKTDESLTFTSEINNMLYVN